MPTPVFWTEATGRVVLGLRRYRSSEGDPDSRCPLMPGQYSYHTSTAMIGEADALLDDDVTLLAPSVEEYLNDERWPISCACGYVFRAQDNWQVWVDRIFTRPDTGERWPLRELPPGAMYDAWWMPDRWRGADGIALQVILPTPTRHPWSVDAEASNCTRKGDRSHRCWVRHGDPRAVPAVLHVDKDGDTCAAGGGSIAVEGYHGHLHHGSLTDG